MSTRTVFLDCCRRSDIDSFTADDSSAHSFLLGRCECRHEFILCKDAVVVRIGRIEIGSDSRMRLRFSPGHFSRMTHVQLVEYRAEIGRLRR